MRKKALALCLSFSMLFALTGCQLAKEETYSNSTLDRLVGVFITKEYLNLFDYDSYIEDNIQQIIDDDKHTINNDSSQYQGRLYATLETLALSANATPHKEYLFPDVKGMAYHGATVTNENGEEYIAFTGDKGISNVNNGVSTTDDGEQLSLEGTIYIASTAKDVTLFFNPIYQSADGRVYAISGNGLHISDGQVSTTLKESTTETKDGESKSVSITIKISVDIMDSPQQIVILEMDNDSAILARTTYTPGELPPSLTPHENTQYIVVEAWAQDPQNNETVTRSLYDRSSRNIYTYCYREDGICVPNWTGLNWSQN